MQNSQLSGSQLRFSQGGKGCFQSTGYLATKGEDSRIAGCFMLGQIRTCGTMLSACPCHPSVRGRKLLTEQPEIGQLEPSYIRISCA